MKDAWSLGKRGLATLVGVMQAMPAGHGLGNLAFLLSGLRRPLGVKATWQAAQDFRPVLIALYFMTALHLLIIFVHEGGLREFEAYGVWLVWPFVLAGLLHTSLSASHLFVGLAIAACVSGVAGLVDLVSINLHPPPGAFVPNSGSLRVAGAMSNPLVFGNLSLLFASCCLCFLARPEAWWKTTKREPHWLWLLGLFFGLLASLLSGTKGGWVAAIMVWPILLLLVAIHRPLKLLFKTLVVLVISFIVSASLPMSSVSDRFSNFYHAIEKQVILALSPPKDEQQPRAPALSNEDASKSQPHAESNSGQNSDALPQGPTNQSVALPAAGIDSSITPRLVQWRLAFSETSAERLFIGMPRAEFIELQKQALALGEAEGLIRPWRNLHNDLIDVFITKGVLGLLSLLVFVVLLLRFFYCRLNHDNHQIRSFAGLGLFVLLMVGLYSISDVQMDKGAVTHSLSFILLCLVALILQASSNSNT